MFTMALQICAHLQIVLLQLWPIYFIYCLYLYLCYTHTPSHAISVFVETRQCFPVQWCGYAARALVKHSIFPHHSVFCLGSQLFLLHIKQHCDFSYFTSTFTPASSSHCCSASSLLYLLSVFPLLSSVLR